MPRPITAPDEVVSLTFPTLAPDCVIKSVTTSFRVSATDLAVSTASGELEVELGLTPAEGLPIVTDLINLRRTGQRLSGTQIGENCTNLRTTFREDATRPFSEASAPYSGAFRPFGDEPPPTGNNNFNKFEGEPATGGRWTLAFKALDEDVTLHCWSVELELERRGTLREGLQP